MDDKERVLLKKFKYAVVMAGLCLSIAKALGPIKGGHFSLGLEFALWAMTPYIVFFVFSWRSEMSYGIVLSGALLFVMDLIAHFYIFFYMSMERMLGVLLFAPVWLTLFVLPVGYLLGWLAERISDKDEKPA